MRHSHIAIIGAPLDLGAGRRGVDMGPSAVRVANLNARLAALGWEVEDLGNVPVSQQESEPEGPTNAKYLERLQLAERPRAAARRDRPRARGPRSGVRGDPSSPDSVAQKSTQVNGRPAGTF